MNRAFAVVVPKCCKGLLGWIDILHDQSRLGCLKTKCGGSGVRKAFTRSPQLLDIAARCLAQQERIGPGEHQVVAVAVKPCAVPIPKGNGAKVLAGCEDGLLYLFSSINSVLSNCPSAPSDAERSIGPINSISIPSTAAMSSIASTASFDSI